jgi:urea transport system substrate-binding protein
MAISELSMIDAERLAIDQINAAGGLLGRRVEAVVADGESDPSVFARQARRLIEEEKVSVIVGCCSSACRKSVKSVVEAASHLLIYPVAYEGMENSPNIIYTGAAPNQQLIPTITWLRDVLKVKSVYLIGTDSVWPHAVSTIVRDELAALQSMTVVGEEYLAFGTSDVKAAVERAVKARPDVILCAIEGSTNLAFYQAIRGAGGAGSSIPIVSFGVTEDELDDLPAQELTNDYLVCNYFQTIDRPENAQFVQEFKSRYGRNRVTSDPVETAYSSVLLWAGAVRDAETAEVAPVRSALDRQSLNAPEGVMSIDRDSRHAWRPFFVGKVQPDGQLDIVWTLPKPIRPSSYPFSRTREEWNAFLNGLQRGWGGRWIAPAGERADDVPGDRRPSEG